MKKYSWALAIISLIISICALIASFRIETFHVGIESVMGLVTALMGICATFMVGWQIFSSINVNRELENLKSTNEEFKEKVKQLDDLIVSQKEEMIKERETRCLMKKEMDAQLWASKAISFVDIQYFTAYECFARALCLFLEIQDYKKIDSTVSNMDTTLSRTEERLLIIEDKKTKKQKYDIGPFLYHDDDSLDGKDCLITELSLSPHFYLIKEKIKALEEYRLRLNERVEKLKQ